MKSDTSYQRFLGFIGNMQDKLDIFFNFGLKGSIFFTFLLFARQLLFFGLLKRVEVNFGLILLQSLLLNFTFQLLSNLLLFPFLFSLSPGCLLLLNLLILLDFTPIFFLSLPPLFLLYFLPLYPIFLLLLVPSGSR